MIQILYIDSFYLSSRLKTFFRFSIIVKKPPVTGWFFEYKLLVLSLACCFRLLLALNAGLLVVLTLAKIGQDVRPCALTLEATESTVQRLALFYLDFCHDFFPSPRIRRRSVADGCTDIRIRGLPSSKLFAYYTRFSFICQ